jgi:hypothetical protein
MGVEGSSAEARAEWIGGNGAFTRVTARVKAPLPTVGMWAKALLPSGFWGL